MGWEWKPDSPQTSVVECTILLCATHQKSFQHWLQWQQSWLAKIVGFQPHGFLQQILVSLVDESPQCNHRWLSPTERVLRCTISRDLSRKHKYCNRVHKSPQCNHRWLSTREKSFINRGSLKQPQNVRTIHGSSTEDSRHPSFRGQKLKLPTAYPGTQGDGDKLPWRWRFTFFIRIRWKKRSCVRGSVANMARKVQRACMANRTNPRLDWEFLQIFCQTLAFTLTRWPATFQLTLNCFTIFKCQHINNSANRLYSWET